MNKENEKKYHVNILVASNTFYMLLLIIPFRQKQFNIFNLNNLYTSGLFFLINSFFVISRYLNNLKLTSDMVYQSVPLRNKWKESIKTFILTFFLAIMVIALINLSFGTINLWEKYIGTNNYPFVKFLESAFAFIIIFFVTIIVFKITIPIYISYWYSCKISLVLTLIWVLLSTVYQIFYNYIDLNIINNETILTLLFIYFIYALNYTVISSFIYYYNRNKNYHNNRCIKKIIND